MSWRPPALITLALAVVLALPGTAAADDPPPPQVESRAGTEAPAEVSGLAEPARAGDPVAAAKEHLAGPRYHLDPGRLAPLGTVTDGPAETVRFAQRHHGLPVLGAHYLVRFRNEGGKRIVTGAGGRFHTELTVGATPAITAETAGRLAVTATAARGPARSRSGLEAGAGELVVVPRGTGVLAWKIPLTGRDPVRGTPVLRDAYVDAHHGTLLFAVDRLHAASPEGPGEAGVEARVEGSVEGSGTTAHGRAVTLPAYRRADGRYELRDRGRPMWNGSTGEILTYDAAGADLTTVLGAGIPPGLKLAESPTPAFGPQHTETGAVDAHWGAGQVYAFYRALGREGLDGRGGSMHSVVNVTLDGQPFANAFWDGTKMVYGGGGADFHPFAAGLDVVGHEMTHGVIEHSANLIYLGQSGAINEGLADYFGNAVEVDALGVPMSDPDASLLGQGLCETAPPRECAIRDLDDDRHATRDYVGATVGLDSGGVHLSSTIFSGALWDIRERLGGAKTDELVYTALTQYMTPLDGFLDARRAVESAARDARWPLRDRLTVALAFDRHGIKHGWDRRIRTDSRVLLDGLTAAITAPDVAGDRYVTIDSDDTGQEPPYIITGRVRGGQAVRLSENPWMNVAPATDGRRAAWLSLDPSGPRPAFQIRTRPLDRGSPETVVHETPANIFSVVVEGDVIAWDLLDLDTGDRQVWVKRGDAEPVEITQEPGVQGTYLSLQDGRLAYIRVWEDGGALHSTPAVYDVASGTHTVVPEVPPTGDTPSVSAVPIMTSGHVVWLVDSGFDGRYGIMRAAADGTAGTALVPDGPRAPAVYSFDAGERAATVSAIVGDTAANRDLPKLFQVPLTGGELERYSCNRGMQGEFAAAGGQRVVWLDGTAGDTDLVTRHRPARRC